MASLDNEDKDFNDQLSDLPSDTDEEGESNLKNPDDDTALSISSESKNS